MLNAVFLQKRIYLKGLGKEQNKKLGYAPRKVLKHGAEWGEIDHSGSMLVTKHEIKACVHIDRPRNSHWRISWRKVQLKQRGLTRLLDNHPDRQGGFHSRKDAESYAKAILEEGKRESDAEKSLDKIVIDELMIKAFKLDAEGLDPVEAIQLGAEQLRQRGEGSETPIGEYWSDYYEAHTKGTNPAWDELHSRQLQKFYELEKDGFFTERVLSLQAEKSGRKAIRNVFERRRKHWTAYNTARQKLSTMRSFLLWIEGRAGGGDLLKEETIRAICSIKKVLPEGLAKEQENYAATPEQARSILQWAEESKEKFCGFAVFKHFTGARTTQLIKNWNWGCIDWEQERITIPRNWTKLGNGYAYNFKDIPNFKEWLEWAYKNDGQPKDEEGIVPYSQSHVTRSLNKWVNEHREIFRHQDADGKMPSLNKKIILKETHHNFMRSAFISYGNKLALDGRYGVTREIIQRVAEDKESWDSYLDSDASSEIGVEWFGMTPDNRFNKLEKI